MHEFKLIHNVMRKIDEVVREQQGTRATAVKVKLGEQAHISPEHFREHFVDAARGTVAEGAMLEIETIDDWSDPLVHDIVLEELEVE
jgi:hydrogenase nickel incorporation protein HypA/HybF